MKAAEVAQGVAPGGAPPGRRGVAAARVAPSGPTTRRPAIESPGAIPLPSRAPPRIPPSRHAWWQQFGDPVLAQLIDEALADNLDVAAAAARVEQFYGALGTTRAQLFPQVGAEFTGGRSAASESSVPPALPATNPRDAYQADLFASWEIDLFGRLRRLTEAARADLLAADEARKPCCCRWWRRSPRLRQSARPRPRLLVAQRTAASRGRFARCCSRSASRAA